jgi:MinD superfamily P-loop ATPase
MHDLKRVLEVCRHFQVPARVCINKADINPANAESIKEFCKEERAPVIGEIPYDPMVTKAMVYESTVIEYSGGRLSSEIQKMWMRLERSLDFPLDQNRASRQGKAMNIY